MIVIRIGVGGLGSNDRNYFQLWSYKMACEMICKYYQKVFRYMLNIVNLNPHVIYRKKWRNVGKIPSWHAEKLSAHGRTPDPPVKWQSWRSPKATRLVGDCYPDPLKGTWKKSHNKMCLLDTGEEQTKLLLVPWLQEGCLCLAMHLGIACRGEFAHHVTIKDGLCVPRNF
jgi:hypothetical protein